MKRWLLVDSSEVFGGHEVMLLRWLEELEHQGAVEPRLFAREGTVLRERAERWATPTSLPARGSALRPFARVVAWVRDALAFRHTLATERPELCVLVDGCLLAQPLLALLTWLGGVPLSIYVPIPEPTRALGFRSGRIRDFLIARVFANLPAAWIVLTREQAEAFARWTSTRSQVLVLPNTVSAAIEGFIGSSTLRASSRAGETQRVLVLGRLDTHQKGLDLLLDFLSAHARALPDVTVTLMGEGPARADVLRRIQGSAALARCVSLVGWSDAASALAQHDALLLTSRFEGVPLVMLEAMALGVPVVASDLAGTRGFLPAECLFPIGDVRGAFQRLSALRDAATSARIVARNRRTFSEKASARAFSRAVSALTFELSALSRARTSSQARTTRRWMPHA